MHNREVKMLREKEFNSDDVAGGALNERHFE